MGKKIIVPIALVAAAFVFQHNKARLTEPGTIEHPVYGETRFSIGASDDSLDILMLTKAASASDCESQTERIEQQIKSGAFAMCKDCSVPQSTCSEVLPPRLANLFENKPSSLTYLSLLRGRPEEREHRLIFWGVSVELSDTLCDEVDEFQARRAGEVTCVRARRG